MNRVHIFCYERRRWNALKWVDDWGIVQRWNTVPREDTSDGTCHKWIRLIIDYIQTEQKHFHRLGTDSNGFIEMFSHVNGRFISFQENFYCAEVSRQIFNYQMNAAVVCCSSLGGTSVAASFAKYMYTSSWRSSPQWNRLQTLYELPI